MIRFAVIHLKNSPLIPTYPYCRHSEEVFTVTLVTRSWSLSVQIPSFIVLIKLSPIFCLFWKRKFLLRKMLKSAKWIFLLSGLSLVALQSFGQQQQVNFQAQGNIEDARQGEWKMPPVAYTKNIIWVNNVSIWFELWKQGRCWLQ